MALTND
jgi:hypothetical protein